MRQNPKIWSCDDDGLVEVIDGAIEDCVIEEEEDIVDCAEDGGGAFFVNQLTPGSSFHQLLLVVLGELVVVIGVFEDGTLLSRCPGGSDDDTLASVDCPEVEREELEGEELEQELLEFRVPDIVDGDASDDICSDDVPINDCVILYASFLGLEILNRVHLRFFVKNEV